MTSTKTRKSSTRKKPPARKKKKAPRFFERIPITRVLLFLALVLFLFASIAAAGYVIFFRVVVADQAGHSLPGGCSLAVADGTGLEQKAASEQKLSAVHPRAAASGTGQNGVA